MYMLTHFSELHVYCLVHGYRFMWEGRLIARSYIHEGERVYIYIHLYTHARHMFVAYCFVHVKKVWYVLN